MIYSEEEPKGNWLWPLLIGFIFLIAPQISLKPLNQSEAILGSIAYYFQFSHQYLTPLIQGREVETIGSFTPSLIMSLFSQDIPNEFLVRFHSFLATLFLTILVATFTYKYSRRKLSAVVAGLCTFSSLIAVKFALVGDLRMLSCFFLSCSWLLLYKYIILRSWKKAWFYSLLALSLAFVSGGIVYVFYFYLPLLFIKVKAINTRRRLWHFDHLLAIIVIALLFSFAWLVVIELFHTEEFLKSALNNRISISTDFHPKLLLHYVLFPFKAIGAFVPWIIFAWPIFCQSYNRVEEDPLLFSYLRTIMITIFLFTWINPLGRVGDLLILIVPLAIMTGFHYPILIRRYASFFSKFVRFIFAITIILPFCLLVYYGYEIFNENLVAEEVSINLILATVSFFVSLRFYFKMPTFSFVWLPFLIATILFYWCYIAIDNIPSSKEINYKKNGSILNQKIPKNTMVYSLTDELYIRQMFYLRRPVSKIFPKRESIHNVSDTDTFESLAFHYYGDVNLAQNLANRNSVGKHKIPPKIEITLPKEVYVIFYNTKPINLTDNAADYNWKSISPAIETSNGKLIRVWFGNRE